MRIVFMGTPDFSVPALRCLAAAHEVVCVYTQPPRPAGRGKQPRPSPVQAAAEDLGIEVRSPIGFRKDVQAVADFAALHADVAVVVAYGLILPPDVLAAPRLGCVNIHASLLPRWRGAAPIQRAIMAGDAETGVTIMQMDEGLDTGGMLAKRTLPITDETTAATLHDDLSAMGAEMIGPALEALAAGTAIPEPQPEDGVTYAAKITKAEAAVDFARPARDVLRHIHGLSPFPGAFVMLEGKRVKLLTAEVAPGRAGAAPGTVIDDGFAIACADGGAIRPLRLQREGRGAVDLAAFLNGSAVAPGTGLSRQDPAG